MTQTVKNQNEWWLYYTFRDIGIIGELSIDDNGTDTEDFTDLTSNMSSENQSSLTGGAYGKNLHIKIADRAQGSEPMVVEVKGKDQADGDATEECTIPANTQKGQCIVVPEPTSGEKWKSITSVLVKATQPSGHSITKGVRVKLVLLPQKSDFTTSGKGDLINFDNGFTYSEGSTSRPVYNKFELDHNKRQRGENTISVSQFYTVFEKSLQFLRDRDFTLKAEVHEDGSAQVVETHYLSNVRLSVPLSVPSDGGDVTQDADGSFKEVFII